MLKRILIVIAVLVVLAIAAVIAIPFLVPKDQVKALVTEEVHQATGRTLVLGGDLDVQLFPVLAVTVDEAAISNPPGMEGDLAQVTELIVELDWMSLLSRELRIQKFVLDRPQIALQVGADGRGNWEFEPPASTPGTPAAGTAAEGRPAEPAPSDTAPAPAEDMADGPDRELRELQLSGVEIRKGQVTYTDAAGESHRLEDLDLTLDMPGLAQPLDLSGKARVDGTDLAFEGRMGELRGLMQGDKVATRLALSSEPATLVLDGQLAAGAAQSFDGDIQLAVPSVPALLALAGQDAAAVPPSLANVDLKGRLSAVPQKLGLSGMTLALGEVTLTGDIVVEPQGDRPRIAADLKTGMLDLNAILPQGGAAAQPEAAPADAAGTAPQTQGGTPAPQASQPAPAAPGGGAAWPDTPIDVSALSMLDLDLSLVADGLRYRKFEASGLEFSVALRDRNLSADLSRLALYGGKGSAQVNVNARGGAPQFAVTADLDGIQAEPVLATLADFDRLAGTGNAKAALTSSGGTVRQAVANLAGNGAILFRDGAIKGINIGQILRSIGSGFQQPFYGPEQATDFSELSGSYSISGGVLTNRDLSMKSPLLRMDGAGTVSIIGKTVDYRAEPELVATAAGQGGADELDGLTVPLLIRGPLEDPAITPDIQGMTENFLKDPDAAIRQLKGLRQNLPGQLQQLLGNGAAPTGDAAQGASPTENPREAVEDAVKGVLGGGKNPGDALRGILNR
ncbi:AsmA family protein [Marinibaculum pumilum]|uniref:AsmA family protein n=1 Tax=Marinibaculum pumilum TaxID=1766165 RepID=A0ABV7KXT7_9PROT